MQPPFNQRLASQRGVFLLNCAELRMLTKSLEVMMAPSDEPWLRVFDISTRTIKDIEDIEERQFQLNIHKQSLFPDMAGLAGFIIKQKARLQWK